MNLSDCQGRHRSNVRSNVRSNAAVVAAVEIWGNAEHPDAVAWLTTGLGKGSAPALALARLINTGSST